MNTWPVQDAMGRFSEMLDKCLREGPQFITRRGCKVAVLISAADWEAATARHQSDFKSRLTAGHGRSELPLPRREAARWRRPPVL